jgi:branched-chain amino acid aminotransferase
LPGITRDTVIQLAKSWGLPVTERRVSVDELYEAHAAGKLEEAFGSGTAAVISPVNEFNWAGKVITVAHGGIGEVSRKLYDAITDIQHGRAEDPFGWVREVPN